MFRNTQSECVRTKQKVTDVDVVVGAGAGEPGATGLAPGWQGSWGRIIQAHVRTAEIPVGMIVHVLIVAPAVRGSLTENFVYSSKKVLSFLSLVCTISLIPKPPHMFRTAHW